MQGAPTLLKLDPPVPPGEVRKPRALKLKPNKAQTAKVAAGTKEADGRKTVPPVEDILHAILPPIPVDDDQGNVLLQCVSAQPANRLDIVHLQERLDERLVMRQAREGGVCSVRAELYSDAFDELIRQVTLECPERGLLLLRIRDELRQTLSAHRQLYRQAVTFGNRKMLVADQGLGDLRKKIGRLEEEKLGLEVKVLELQSKCETIESDAQAQRALDDKAHGELLNYYRKTQGFLHQQLKQEGDKKK